MARKDKVTPKPLVGEIAGSESLATAQLSVQALLRGFGGIQNPTAVWQQMVSDSPNAFALYRELELKDADISGALETLKLSILGRDRQVTPADESQLALDVSDFVQQQLAGIKNFDLVLDALLDAPAYGVTIAEMIFDVTSDLVSIIEIKDRAQERFSFNPYGQVQDGPLRLLSGFGDLNGKLVPEEKFLVNTHHPRNGNRRGSPLLRAVFWESWIKRQALRMWMRFGEKGSGTVAVMFPNSASDAEKEQALAAAEMMVEKIAVAVPENFKIMDELLKGARTQNPAVFENLIEKMESNIRRRILGQTLTTQGSEGGAGSLALGQVHGKVGDQREAAIAKALQSVINDQLVRPLVSWNFGPDAPLPKWTISMEDEEDLSQLSIVLDRLQLMGVPIPKSWALKKLGIPDVKEDDELLLRAPDFERLQRMGLAIPGSYARHRFGVPEPVGNEDVLVPAVTPSASGGGDAQLFANAEVRANVTDLDRISEELRDQAKDLFGERVGELVKTIAGGAQ